MFHPDEWMWMCQQRGSGSGSPPPSSLLLDDLTATPLVAYSTRKLSGSYAGSAIRVRRSSDNTEQDIGFVDDELDTDSLLTFCGAGSGYVTTYYDQSGNGRDRTQSSASAQPQIVNSGSLRTINSKPAIRTDGSAQFLTGASADAWIAVSSYTLVTISKLNSATDVSVNQLLGQQATDDNGRILSLTWSTPSSNTVQLNQWADSASYSVTGTTNQLSIIATKNGASGSSLYVGGSLVGSDPAPVGTLAADYKFNLGAGTYGSFQSWNGHFSEFIMFGSVISGTDRSTIYSDQSAYWGV